MTAAEHFRRLLEMPCIVSGMRPVTRHHILGGSAKERLGVRGSKKHSDWLSLPLHEQFHQGKWGIHTLGADSWEAMFEKQTDLIDKLGADLGLDLWALAEQEAIDERANRRAKPVVKRSKPYRAPTKQVPRGTS